ncbi:hypothetical protein [Candidatus Palauibacter sp.]|uniref:hypothetical protein n=1 Tax=Candidatus Palauibacter sp. TaxID=3101350 RepID=UPI003B026CB6
MTGQISPSCSTPSVISIMMFVRPVRTTVLCQNWRVRGTGTETMLSRLSDVAVRLRGGASPLRSNHVFTACDQSAIAWIAVVLPQLFGPIRTVG